MNIDLSDANYLELITCVIGVVFVVGGLSLSAKRKKLLSTGIRVNGVVFSVEKEVFSTQESDSTYSYPIIRFVTVEKEWVTEKYEYAVNTSSSIVNTSYKEGDIKSFIIDDFNAKVIGLFLQ